MTQTGYALDWKPTRVDIRLKDHLENSNLPLDRLISLLGQDGISEPVAILALARLIRAGEVEHVGRLGVYRLTSAPAPTVDMGGAA